MNEEAQTVELREVTPEVIMKQIGPRIDDALSRAAQVAAAITDEQTRDVAITMAEEVQGQIDLLTHKPCPEDGDKGGWREQFYIPAYRLAESLRDFCDSRIKRGNAVKKTLLSGVSDFNVKKERAERIAREAREAEARRIQEEADRKKREAEEAVARAKAAAEAEARRKQEAEAAEVRRIQAEKEAKERAEREAREAAAKEVERKQREEEDHRLAHAQEAQDQGAGQRVDGILSNATAISPTLAAPQQSKSDESLRLENEQAKRLAQEKADKEAQEAAESRRKLDEAEAAAAKAKASALQLVAAPCT